MRVVTAPASVGSSVEPDEFEFVSSVNAAAWKEVEALFFFHPRQQAWTGSIRSSVEEFGQPQILTRGERICIGISQRDTQCLFACHRRRRPGVPVGVVMYLRTQADLLNILHVAVAPAYERQGAYAEHDLATRLVGAVRQVARRISGVRRVGLPYGGGRTLAVQRLTGQR